MSTTVDDTHEQLSRREKNLVIHHPVVLIAEQQLAELPIAKDLPRLVKKIELFQGFATELNQDTLQVGLTAGTSTESTQKHFINSENETDQAKLVYCLLQAIFECIDIGSSFPLYELYSSQVSLTSPDTFNHFMATYLGEGHPLVKVLKVVQQNVILAVIMKLKNVLKRDNVLFKDVAGAWKIQVYFPADFSQDDDHNHKICVVHKRSEQVYEKVVDTTGRTLKNVMLFQFEWQLCFFFNEDGTLYDINAHYVGFQDDPQTQATHQALCDTKKSAILAAFSTINDSSLALEEEEPLSTGETQIQVTPNTPEQEPHRKKSLLGSLKNVLKNFSYVSEHDDDRKSPRSPRSPRSPHRSPRGGSDSFDLP